MRRRGGTHITAGDTNKEQTFPNETIELLFERASCRNFKDDPIPDDIMDYVLRAGVHAASGGNLQPLSIIKIDDPELKNKIYEIDGQHFIGKAPVNLLFCIDWHRLERWAKIEKAPFTATKSFRHFWISFQDTIIAAQSICTAADAMGLGSVYVGTIVDYIPELRRILDLPEHVFPVVMVSMGYPLSRPEKRKKLAPDVLVHNNKYRELPDDELKAAFENKYPGQRIEISDERLAEVEKVCKNVQCDEFAAECIDDIKKCGYINIAQKYFALHYSADVMPQGNENYLKIAKDAGFGWFDKYEAH